MRPWKALIVTRRLECALSALNTARVAAVRQSFVGVRASGVSRESSEAVQ